MFKKKEKKNVLKKKDNNRNMVALIQLVKKGLRKEEKKRGEKVDNMKRMIIRSVFYQTN